MSLRIPLTNDQTLQVEFHEIERRLRKIERSVSKQNETTLLKVGGGSSDTSPTLDLTSIYDRLSALEEIVADFGTASSVPEFNPVGDTARAGIVPSPGIEAPPSAWYEHVLTEDRTWSFPARGLLRVATATDELGPGYDVVNLPAIHAGHVSSADVECFNLHTHGDVEYSNTFWDDLRFPAQAINPVGAASDPGVDDATGLLVFSGVQDNVIAGVAQMPHGWKTGTAVYPHIHLRFPTSAVANTRWKYEYDIANIDGDFTNNSGTYTTLATVTVANAQNVKRHVMAQFGALTMTGFTESAVILWKISRLANSDAADNDTNDCELLEYDIHYEIGKPGTGNVS